MSLLPLLLLGGALAAGALLSLGVLDLLGSIPRIAAWIRSSFAPLWRAGEEGYLPTPAERRRIAVLAAVAALATSLFVSGFGPLVLLAAAGPPLAFALIRQRRSRYRANVENALPEVSGAIADSMSGGASLATALADADRSLQGAAAKEFARVRVDLGLGLTTRESLGSLAERLRSERIDALVTLLLAGSASGGDLVLLLHRFGEADRSRRRTLKDAESATAQARYTGLMVVALPAGAALFAELVRPGFFGGIVSDPTSTFLLVAALILQVLGLSVVRRLGRGGDR